MSGYALKSTLNLPPQRVTLRCVCGWYMRNVLVSEATRIHARHVQGTRHTGRNRKAGAQAKTSDRHAGYSWAKGAA